MTDSPTSQAMHLAMTELEHRRERIAELEDVLRTLLAFIDCIADERPWCSLRVSDFRTSIGPDSKAVYEAARSVLNKETNRG